MISARTMSQKVSAFFQDEEAASAVEYGLLASLIAAAIIAVLNTMGTKLSNTFSTVSSQLK